MKLLSNYNSMQALIFKLKVIILFKKGERFTLVYMILWSFLLIAMAVPISLLLIKGESNVVMVQLVGPSPPLAIDTSSHALPSSIFYPSKNQGQVTGSINPSPPCTVPHD